MPQSFISGFMIGSKRLRYTHHGLALIGSEVGFTSSSGLPVLGLGLRLKASGLEFRVFWVRGLGLIALGSSFAVFTGQRGLGFEVYSVHLEGYCAFCVLARAF